MAIAFVGLAVGAVPGSSATCPTSSRTWTSGNAIIGYVSWEDIDRNVTVTDAGGVNSYSTLTQPLADGTHGCLFYALNITGFTGVVTPTLDGNADFKNSVALEYSGIKTTGALEAQNTGRTPIGTTTTIVTGTVANTTPDALIVVGHSAYGSVNTTPGANWTERHDAGTPIHFFDKIVSSASTYSVVAGGSANADGISMGANNWVAVIGAFAAASGAPAPKSAAVFRRAMRMFRRSF